MPESDGQTVEQNIAVKLHEVYEFVRGAAENSRDDHVRHGALSLIAVLLHQPLEAIDRLASGSTMR
jgi:hypothetical protein